MPAPRSPRRLAVALATALVLGTLSCEGACGKAHDLTEAAGERLITVEAEAQIGAQLAAQFREKVTLVDDPEVVGYIDELGERLVAAATPVPEGLEFHFAVIDDSDVINAIAMPGGYIYVYSGLMIAASTEAELAGVIAHEVAHVAERHVVAQLVTVMGIQTIRAILAGERETQVGALIGDFITRGALGAYSRTAEREADELGVQALVQAGYSPTGYAAFFDKLAADRGSAGPLTRFASSHPEPAERAERARELAAKMKDVPDYTGDGTLATIVERLPRSTASR